MRVRMAVVAGLLLATALLTTALTGCGKADGNKGVATAGGGSASPTGSAGSDQQNEQEQALKFAQCMRAHGINIADPKPGTGGQNLDVPDGTDPTKVDAAMKACKQYLPNGGEPQKLDPARLAMLRKLAQCMRGNGVPNFPDPTDYGIQMNGNTSGIDPNSASYKAAQAKCAQYQPAPASGEPTEATTQNGGNG